MRAAKVLFLLGFCLATPIAFAQNSLKPVPAPRAVFPKPGGPLARPFTQPITPVDPGVPTLVFDSESKEYDAKPAEMVAPFTFHLTNVWSKEVVVLQVHPSCGCTTADLPPTPWRIPPGGTGEIGARVSLMGKPPGLLTKTMTMFTSVGNRTLTLKVHIPMLEAGLTVLTAEERKAAMTKAAADPQAIFRGDCAKCHVDKGVNTTGQDLYAADCGICHESPHRETSVPDLHALKHPTDLDYWKTIIALGKPHTLMPGFATAHGGPLTDSQVASLAAYLDRTISHHFASAPMPSPPAAHF